MIAPPKLQNGTAAEDKTIVTTMNELLINNDHEEEEDDKNPFNNLSFAELLLAHLSGFFENSIEMNLVLTGDTISLAMCPDHALYNRLYYGNNS